MRGRYPGRPSQHKQNARKPPRREGVTAVFSGRISFRKRTGAVRHSKETRGRCFR
jgi:hypothetical protein